MEEEEYYRQDKDEDIKARRGVLRGRLGFSNIGSGGEEGQVKGRKKVNKRRKWPDQHLAPNKKTVPGTNAVPDQNTVPGTAKCRVWPEHGVQDNHIT